MGDFSFDWGAMDSGSWGEGGNPYGLSSDPDPYANYFGWEIYDDPFLYAGRNNLPTYYPEMNDPDVPFGNFFDSYTGDYDPTGTSFDDIPFDNSYTDPGQMFDPSGMNDPGWAIPGGIPDIAPPPAGSPIDLPSAPEPTQNPDNQWDYYDAGDIFNGTNPFLETGGSTPEDWGDKFTSDVVDVPWTGAPSGQVGMPATDESWRDIPFQDPPLIIPGGGSNQPPVYTVTHEEKAPVDKRGSSIPPGRFPKTKPPAQKPPTQPPVQPPVTPPAQPPTTPTQPPAKKPNTGQKLANLAAALSALAPKQNQRTPAVPHFPVVGSTNDIRSLFPLPSTQQTATPALTALFGRRY